MRHIDLAEGLRLRFPARPGEFDDGVEIGILATGLASGQPEFAQRIAMANLDQARALAERFGYRLTIGEAHDERAMIVFRTGRERPRLLLISTQAASDVKTPPPTRDQRRRPMLGMVAQPEQKLG